MERTVSTPSPIMDSSDISRTPTPGTDSTVDDRLASLEAQMTRLAAIVACREQQIRTERLATLDKWWDIINSEGSSQQSAVPPQDRGDILNDIVIIRAMSTFMPDKASKWKEVFEKAYGITFETASCADLLLKANARVITVFNIAAETLVGQKWRATNGSASATRVRSLCMTIIDEWLVHPEGLLEPGSVNEKAYNELLERYNFPRRF